jgi:hypothetical protein
MVWKSSETEIQNKMEGHSSRLEQAEERISELGDEMEIKEKLLDNSSPVKETCKNSTTPSKDKTGDSWALKKKRCKKKELVM